MLTRYTATLAARLAVAAALDEIGARVARDAFDSARPFTTEEAREAAIDQARSREMPYFDARNIALGLDGSDGYAALLAEQPRALDALRSSRWVQRIARRAVRAAVGADVVALRGCVDVHAWGPGHDGHPRVTLSI